MNNTIHVLDEQQTLVVKVQGALDESLSPQLEDILMAQKLNNDQTIIIQLDEVSKITPDGVRVLLNSYIKQGNTGLVLKNPNDEVRELLTTVGLANLIDSQ